MLIPSKFSGYQEDGRRIYPIGGGVGEAMLLGAAVGGGSAAITGGDPLKGALLGGLTGGIGGGISGTLANTAANTAATAGTTAAGSAGIAGLGGAASPAALAALPTAGAGAGAAAGIAPNLAAGISGLPAGQSFMQAGQAALQAAAPEAISSSVMQSALPMTSQLPGAAMGAPEVFTSAMNSPAAFAPPAAVPGGFTPPNIIPSTGGTFTEGMARFASDPLASIGRHKFLAGAAGLAGAMGGRRRMEEEEEEYKGPLSRFRYSPDSYVPAFADGGIASLPLDGYDMMVGEAPAYQAMASGGLSDLGSYSDGGRMLRGPGDGMSDNIPGVIGGRRPARLADGEFVVPADVVSHLGNGSTDAGARQLYAMMDKVRTARTGRKAQGREINPRKYMPA